MPTLADGQQTLLTWNGRQIGVTRRRKIHKSKKRHKKKGLKTMVPHKQQKKSETNWKEKIVSGHTWGGQTLLFGDVMDIDSTN